MDGRRRALVLVAVGIALIGGTLVVSAATAPDRATDDGEHRQTLVGSQGGGAGWHEYGSVFLLNGSEQTWTEDSAGSYFDVTMLPNGSVMAGFMNTGVRGGCGPYDSPCARTGFRILDPDADGGPTVVSEHSFPVRSASNSEVHDVERLESGEYLMTGMDAERVFTVRGDEVTWQWNASTFYTPPEDPTRRDWLHINDVDAINQSHYLVSVRNANQLLVIERGAGVAEVINRDVEGSPDDSCLVRGTQLVPDEDGDVRCGNPDVLNHQHNPQWLGDGGVLVADSDNDRVVELHRTEDGDWEPAWVLDRAGDIALNWPRDADRLDNGNTLVTDTLNKRLFEVTENGTVVWSTTTEYIPYEAERLPEGERTSAAKYAVDDSVESPGESVPVLSTGLTVLRAGFPWLPFWFTETQLGISVLGVALIAGGGIDRWRAK